MKKRIIALLLALVLTVSCLPPVALAEGIQPTEANTQSVEQTQSELPEKVEEETAPALNAAHGAHTCEDCSDSNADWKPWESGTDLPTNGHYYLTQNVVLDSTFVNGKSLTGASTNLVLCLNGHTITSASRIYRVSKSAKLTICDCTGTGIVYGGKSIGGVVGVFNDDNTTGSKVSIYNVTLDGTKVSAAPTYGGAVLVNAPGATLNLKGVTIRNFSVTGASGEYAGGAAVYMRSTSGTSSLSMEDCTVTGCTDNSTADSGAVRCYQATTATFTNCVFQNNTSSGTGASALMLRGTAATMSGCTVTGNSSTKNNWVGAVYVNPSVSMTLSGKNVIKNNTAGGVNQTNLVLNELTVSQFLSFKNASSASELYITAERDTADPNALIKLTAGDPIAFTYENSGTQYYYNVAQSKFLVQDHTHASGYADAPANTVWQPWTSTNSLPTSGYYYLTENVTLTSVKALSTNGAQLTLCLNGKTVTAPAAGRVFRVSNGHDLTVCDHTGTGKLLAGAANGGAIALVTDTNDAGYCDLKVYDITIEGTAGNTPKQGGGITCTNPHNSATLKNVTFKNLTTIAGPDANSTGGSAIFFYSAQTDTSLYLEGCSFTGCADNGNDMCGTVRVRQAKSVTIKNCSFTNNTAASVGASAVILSGAKDAKMEGCTITGNKTTGSTAWAGAVYVFASSDLTLSGKNIIENNTIQNGSVAANLVLVENASGTTPVFLHFNNTDTSVTQNITAKRGTTDPNALINVTSGSDVFSINYSDKTYYYNAEQNKFVLSHMHTDGYADVAGSVTWQPWEKVGGKYPTNGHFYLTGELNMDARVDLTKSTDHLHLCLNGQTLTAQAASRIFRVSNGAKLTICDCTGNGVIKGGSANGGIVAVFIDANDTANGSKINICDVTMEGTAGNNPNYGGAILAYATNVQLNIKNVTFRNFTIENGTGSNTGGAAIFASGQGGSLYMENCTVTGCTDKSPDTSAAVRVLNLGSAEFKNCTFTNNSNTGNGASALMLSSTTATMSGCTFTGNTSTKSWSGVVFVYDSATLTLTGKNDVELALCETTKDQTKQFLKLQNIDSTSKITAKAMRGTTDPNKMVGVTGTETFDVTFGSKTYYYDVASDKLLLYHYHQDGYAGVAGTTQWKPWTSTTSLPTSGYWYLTDNVQIADVRFAEIKNDNLFLCLNGKTITARAAGTDGKTNIFRLSGSGDLTICDCGKHTTGGTYSAGKLTGASMGALFTMISSTGVINFYDGIVTGNTTNDSGAAAVIQNTCQMNIYGGEFSGNTATNNGGAIYIGAQATVTVAGGTFTGNHAPKDGGAIVTTGTLNLQGGKFTGNTSGINGGAIHSGGVLNISGNPEITGNTANGIANNLYLTTGKSLTLGAMAAGTAKVGISMALNTLPRTFSGDMGSTDCTAYFFSDNADYKIVNQGNKLHMKAIFSHESSHAGVPSDAEWQAWTSTNTLPSSGYWVLTEDVTLNARFAEIKNNDLFLCLNGKTVTARAAGSDGKTNIFRLTGTGSLTICDCSAHTDASGNYVAGKLTGASMGAIFTMASSTGVINFYDGIVTGNTTNDSGAVAVIQNTCQMNIYGGEFSGNTATNNGGAIYIGAQATVTVAGGTFTGNHAPKDGGAIVNTGTLNLQGGKFTGNTAGLNGGAIHSGGVLNISGTPEITGNTVNSNANNLYLTLGKMITLGDLAEDTSKIGISVSFTSIPRFLSEDMGSKDVSACFTSDDPYRIITAKDNRLYITHGNDHKHCHCAGLQTDVCDHDKQAWGAWINTTTLPTSGYWYLTGDVSLASTDGITVSDDLHLCLNGYKIDGNAHVILKIRSDDHDVVITDCRGSGEITNGSALNYGAIYLEKGSFTMFGGKLTNHHNTQTTEGGWSGGAIQARDQLTLVGVTLEGNSSTTEGGAICLREKGTAYLEGCTFTGNSAKNGGAIYTNSKNDITITDCTFDGNTASVNGGAIYARDCVITLESGSLTGNSANHGGAIYCVGATLNLQSGTISQNTARVQGGAIFATECVNNDTAQASQINISGGLISANQAPDGAGMATIRSTQVNMTGGKISENIASNAAGGVLLQTGSSMVISGENTMIIYNKASTEAGGVFVSTNSQLTMDGGKISANTAGSNGGGITVLGGTMTMNDGHIYQNTAASGGGIYAKSGSRMVDGKTLADIGATIVINNGNISTNTATSDGGAVAIRGENTQFTLKGGSIQKNTAPSGGGILAIVQSKVHIQGGIINNNTSEHSGGGIFMSFSTQLTMDGGKITENTCGSNGGGVYLLGVTMDISGGSITKNTAAVQGGGIFATYKQLDETNTYYSAINMTGGFISGNKAADGAGIATARYAQIIMTGGRITENEASHAAGGILLQTGSTLTLSGEDTMLLYNKSAGDGGGVYISSNSTVIMDGGKVSANTSDNRGGGIYIASGTLTINNGHVYQNSAKEGGGVYANNTDNTTSTVFTLDGGNISTNTSSTDGGGVKLRGENTVFTMKSGTIQKNTATHGAGVLAIVKSQFNMEGGNITANQASGNGAGIYMSTETAMTMTGGSITENGATLGAGIYLLRSTLNMEGGNISKNIAKNFGGAVFAEGGTMNLKNGKIAENEAGSQGGALYGKRQNLANSSTISVFNISGGLITANKAPDGAGIATIRATEINMTGGHIWGNEANNGAGVLLQTGSNMIISNEGLVAKNIAVKSGGGIYVSSDSSLTMNAGGKITENIAGENGGGVYLLGTTFTMNDGTIWSNKATSGGGVYAKSSGDVGAKFICKGGNVSTNSADDKGSGGGAVTLYGPETVFTLDGGYVQKNTAPNGGAVLAMVQSKVEVKSGTMYNNSAERSGGAIYVSTDCTMEMTGGKITNNSAKTAGGAIYLLSSELTMKDGSIQYNTTDNYGGAINAEGSVMNLKGGQILGNEAKKQGGGIYGKYRTQKDKDDVYTKINLNGVQLTKNRAKDGAGIATIRYTKVTMTGGSVSGNVAEMSAGGILLQTSSSMTLSGGSVSSNIAQKGSAGGVYASTRCSFNMTGGTISNNKAKATAGGVYLMYAPGNFTGGKIQGNKAETEAGGIYVRGSKAILDGTDVLDNEAKNGGGLSTVRYPNEKEGIDAQPELIIKSGRIAGNKATNGGGMILQSQSETKMLGGSIENNYAKSYGGAVYVSMNHTFNVTGGKITGNTADGWGGAMYHLRGSNGHYEGFELSYNKAKSIGGAIIINGTEAQPSSVTMKNVQIIGNEAREGAGVRTQDRFQSFQAEGCTFKDNKATNYAGGLMIFFGLEGVKIKDCLFENNVAGTGQGGGIYIMSALVDCEIVGCTFKGNTAGTEGGAMWTQGGLLVKDCTFDDNHAQLEGGAIATDCFANTRVRHPVLYVENCSITNNTSGTNGGGIYADTASYINVSDTEICNNTSKAEGGAMWIVDDSKLHNITMTGNRSGGEGYALYYHASEYDGLSYIRGSHRIGGEMIIKDNEGGDMYMGEQTGIAVSDAGLTGDTYMSIRLHSGYLTQLLRGAYNYDGGDTLYTVTPGNRSLTDPEVFAEAQANTGDDATGTALTPAVWVGGGALIVALIAIAAIVLILSKKKKAAAGK